MRISEFGIKVCDMNKKHNVIMKSIINGFLCSLLLHIILLLYFSKFVDGNSLLFVIIIILSILVSLLINHLFLNSIKTIYDGKKYTFLSWLFYVLGFISIAVTNNMLDIDVINQRDVSSSEGIGLIIFMFCFRLIYMIAVIIQLFVFIERFNKPRSETNK